MSLLGGVPEHARPWCLLAGWAAVLGGLWLLYRAYDGSGHPAPWPLSGALPW